LHAHDDDFAQTGAVARVFGRVGCNNASYLTTNKFDEQWACYFGHAVAERDDRRRNQQHWLRQQNLDRL